MWGYFWPILLVIGSNVVYNICTKSTPAGANPLAALAVTYVVAAISVTLLYFATSETKNLLGEFKGLNWTSIVLGLSVVALEFGYIRLYRAGWNVSVGSLVANIGLAVVLLVVGVILYRERITANQFIGAALCLAGLLFINKR